MSINFSGLIRHFMAFFALHCVAFYFGIVKFASRHANFSSSINHGNFEENITLGCNKFSIRECWSFFMSTIGLSSTISSSISLTFNALTSVKNT